VQAAAGAAFSALAIGYRNARERITAFEGDLAEARRRAEELEAENEELKSKVALADQRERTDSMTGIGSRVAFDEKLDSIRSDASPWVLMMMDADGLNRINAAHGHAGGDEVIRHIARELHKRGFAFRLGTRADEFTLLVPGSIAAALEEAGRLWSALRFPHAVSETATHSTVVSIGLVTVTADVGGHELKQRADLAVYVAKDAGPDADVADKIVVWSRDLERQRPTALPAEHERRQVRGWPHPSAHAEPDAATEGPSE
jgi:diguanylate cyclase (GGDEF)-like protein